MKDTDDGKTIDGSDEGAIPSTSTNTESWADKPERLGPGLGGRNVHGVQDKPKDWYYSPQEWSRSIGWGQVPDERNTELRGVNQDRRTDENLQEESDTQYKRQR